MSDVIQETPEGEVNTPPIPAKGGLPIGLVASIQKLYQRDRNKGQPMDTKSAPVDTSLETGWGGKGR